MTGSIVEQSVWVLGSSFSFCLHIVHLRRHTMVTLYSCERCDRKDAFGGRGRSGWRRVWMCVVSCFVYALVGMMGGMNGVCSSRSGRSSVDRCGVEFLALRGIDRDLSAADSVWSFTRGVDGEG